MVVVTKFDAWRTLAPNLDLDLNRLVRRAGNTMSALDSRVLRVISDAVRQVLNQHAPEMVTAAEGFSEEVLYIPVSALGCAPEVIDSSGMLGIRPRNIHPIWSEVPVLFALHRCTKGLVQIGTSRGESPAAVARATDSSAIGAPAEAAADEDEPPVLRMTRETGT